MHESRHESMLLVIKTMELVIESMQESMFLAFLLTRTMFTVLKGNTKYVNSNDGTNPISAVKIMESLNLVWKMITKVAATNATRWKVAPSGTQGR